MKLKAAIFALGIAGCSSTQWAHESKTEQDYHHDHAECLAFAITSAPNAPQVVMPTPYGRSPGFYGGIAEGVSRAAGISAAHATERLQNELYESCMKGRGWRQVGI